MLKSDIAQSFLSFLTKFGSGVAAYVLFAIISRTVGTEAFGQFGVLFSLAVLIGIGGSVGQQIFIVREVPSQRARHSLKGEKSVYRFSARMLQWAAVPTIGIFILCARYLESEASTTVVTTGALLALFYAISQTTIGMLRVQDATIQAIFTRDLLWRLVAIPAVLALGQILTGPEVGVLALLISLAPITLWHMILIRRYIRSHLAIPAGLSEQGWVNSSLGLGLIGVISSADFYIYTIFVGLLISSTEAGLFFASLKTAELLNMILMAVTLVMAPRLSYLIASRKTDELQQQCNLSVILQTLPLILSMAILLPLSSMILYFFDPVYAPAWPLLWILAFVMLFNALTGATVLLMQVGGMHWQQVWLQGGFLLLSLAALPFLIKFYGVYGVALSFAASKILWNVAAIYFIRRRLGVDPSVLGLFRKEGGGMRKVIKLIQEQLGLRKQET